MRELLSFKQSRGMRKIKSIKDYYDLNRELGTGSFGSVLLAKHKKSKCSVAIKVIEK